LILTVAWAGLRSSRHLFLIILKKIPIFCRFEMFKLAGEGEDSCRKSKPIVLQPNVLKEPEPENLSTENHAPAIS
jgi:hypothetical protein